MKKIILLLAIYPLYLFAQDNDSERLPKGQLNGIFQSDPGADAGNWQFSGPWKKEQFSGTEDLCAGIGFSGFYAPGIDSRLVSPVIELPGINAFNREKIVLAFDEFFSLESSYDEGTVEVSRDGGATWDILDFRSGTSENRWRRSTLYLDIYAGESVQIAFRLKSDENFSGEGWFVKNVEIKKATYTLSPSRDFLQMEMLKSGQAGFTGTMNSLNSQNFPYIYMNILLTEDDQGVSNLLKSDFEIYENETFVTNYNVIPPNGTSGSKLIDIIFLVDNSGSFDKYQNAARNNMESFVNQLATSGNDFALGLCRFGQSSLGGDPILEDNGQLTSSISYFKDDVWLRNRVDGGTEPAYWSIVKSAQEFNFRPGSQKIFIILADENPAQGGNTKEEAQNACLNNYITLFALTTSSSRELNDIAAATNGRSYAITDPFTDILSDISASVNNNYLISYRSPNPTMDGVERQVRVHATSKTGASTDITGSYIPGSAPQIERTSETIDLESKGWPENQEFTITAEITDSHEPFVTRATLYYKHSGSTTYSSAAMTNASGNLWSAIIPGSVSQNPGVDYYITATDGTVTSSLPKVDPSINPFQIGILPNEKPVITHTIPTTSFSPGATLSFEATVVDITNWVESVVLWYRNEGELLYNEVQMVKTTGDTYACDLKTPTSTMGIEYYISAEDDFGLTSNWASPDHPQVINSGQLPNLAPYPIAQYNWASPLIVAVEEDASETATLIYDDQEIFVSFAYMNVGNTTAGSHETQLKIDGSVIKTWSVGETQAGYFNYLLDYSIGTLSAGSHTISFTFDTGNQVSESDEADNTYSKTITVLPVNTSVANLAPYTPENWDAPVVVSSVEGATTHNEVYYDDEDLFLSLCYANFGEVDAGPHLSRIFIDETADTLYWNETEGLESMTYQTIKSYNMGKLGVGEHILRFVVDADNEVIESNETDNEYSDTITVIQRYQPNLRPYHPGSWDGSIVVSTQPGTSTNAPSYTTNDNIYIDAAWENNGEIASSPYHVRIYIDSLMHEFHDPDGIGLTEYTYINDFIAGKLSEGSHDITLFVDCFDEVAESDETDNILILTIQVTKVSGVDLIHKESDIKVWPNPASANLNIDLREPSYTDLSIIDLSGRVIRKINISGEQTIRLATNNLIPGTYLLKIVGKEVSEIRKFIIQ